MPTKHDKSLSIRFTPKIPLFAHYSITIFEGEDEIGRKQFHGRMSMEALDAIFPEDHSHIEVRVDGDVAILEPYHISSISFAGRTLRSGDVFEVNLGSKETLILNGTEEFIVEAFEY